MRVIMEVFLRQTLLVRMFMQSRDSGKSKVCVRPGEEGRMRAYEKDCLAAVSNAFVCVMDGCWPLL